MLATALRGELVGAVTALEGREVQIRFIEPARALAKKARRDTFRTPRLSGVTVDVYQANIGELGLLGASIAGDLTKIYSRLRVDVPETDAPTDYGEELIEMFAKITEQLKDDVYHVAMRLRDFEFGQEVRETLFERDMRLRREAAGKVSR